MICKRCGNEDPKYFYKDQDTWYCRKCIAFGRMDVDCEPVKRKYQRKKHHVQYQLKYPLTKAQEAAVTQIREFQEAGHDVLVYAACGAGKTELVMDSMMRYLNKGYKVGFAISRRQVVLEIAQRMKEAFPTLHVIPVCEGYCEVIDADIIVCTMHQLYRYYQTFDLLIMDEIDAFPYRGNAMLKTIAMNACVGRKLYLTATPDEETLQAVEKGELKLVELFQRPHGYPLIVPDIIHTLPWIQVMCVLYLLWKQRQAKKQILLFVPTIAQAKHYHRWMRLFFRCAVFTSKTVDKEKIIDDFHAQKYDFLISTTILERGITIKGINIIILHADHPVFNEASLIQMIGRVGRNIDIPTGKGWFLCAQVTTDIKRCVRALKKMNASLPDTTEKTVKLRKEEA